MEDLQGNGIQYRPVAGRRKGPAVLGLGGRSDRTRRGVRLDRFDARPLDWVPFRKDGRLETRTASRARAIVGATTAAAFAWAAVLGPAPEALADGARSIAIFPIAPVLGGAPVKTALQVTVRLATELGKSDAFRLVPLSGHRSAAAAAPEAGPAAAVSPFHGAGERDLARGRGFVAHGEHEMARLRFDQAAQDFLQGILLIESSFDSLEDFSALPDAYLDLAVAVLRLGRRDEGMAALQSFVRLDPGRKLPRGKYPAVFVRMQQTTEQRLASGPQGTLLVQSIVPGQPVVVDGREVGTTPATLQLVPGRHFVLVRGTSGQVAYRVDVPEGGRVEAGEGAGERRPVVAAAPAEPAVAPISEDDRRTVGDEIKANRLEGPGDVALARIARAAGVEFVLLGGLHAIGDSGDLALDLFLYSAHTDQLAPVRRVRFDSDLLGAPLEIYKAVQALAGQARPEGLANAVALPVPVARDIVPPAPKAAPPPVVAANPPPQATPDDDDDDKIPVEPVHRRGEGEARRPTPPPVEAPPARVIEPNRSDWTSPPDVATHRSSDEGQGMSGWVIGGITAGAVVVAIVAGVLIYGAVTAKPTQGLANVTWASN